MKIATFNINNVNKRLPNLLRWLNAARPDVVSLQELKAGQSAFPRAEIEGAGYGAAWVGERSWNGVAILARNSEPVVTQTALPGDPADKQSRYLEAAVNGVVVTSIYAPNGNPQPGPKFTYKLNWMKRLAAHAAELYSAGIPVVLAGDYNVVPTDRDIYPTRSYARNALVQPQSRAALQTLLAQGWVDAIRTMHPDASMYTFWDYMRNRWPRDAGLRLDHLLLSASAAKRLVGAGVDREVRGEEGASDHAPAWIVLRDRARGPLQAAPRTVRPRAATPRVSKARTEGRPLLVIDGDSYAHRFYHALPKTIRTTQGEPAGAVVGFANLLLRLHRAEEPRAILVAWDTYEAPTYRHRSFPAYQSGRKFDDALLRQFPMLRTFVDACGITNARAPGYEADDFVATAVTAEERRGGTALIASGDRDTFQLASDRTTILFPVRAGVVERIGPARVRERYGVDPAQVPDFIALRGDPSDKLPGAKGIGPAGAAALVRKYGSLDAALDAGRLASQADALRLFRSIAVMDRKAPVPKLHTGKPTWFNAAALAREWGLKQLAVRLEEAAVSS